MNPPKLSGFELLQKVGQGGMGVVWKARQLSLDRIVAVKLLPPELSNTPEEVKRIMTEARTAARLKHPGIVQVYDASEESGAYYFVMEYVDGYNVGEWIRRKKTIPWKDALLVAEYVAAALDYAWQTAGMIHCDIKPENVMVDQDGTIKVSDLGLSLTRETGGTEALTEILGTPSYMSPEQVRGDAPLDCRTDIYSLGATLYHMVTGRRMFQEVPDRQAMDCQLTHHVPDPQDTVPTIPAAVCSLIERMLVKDREARIRDWPAAIADIRRVQRGLMPAGKAPPEGASTVKRSRVRIRRGGSEDGNGATEKPRSSSGGRWVLLALIVGALAAAALLLPKWLEEWRARKAAGTSDAGGTSGGFSFGVDESWGRDQAVAVLKGTDEWLSQNPQRFEEATMRYRRIISQFPGTPAAETALQRVKQMRDARDMSISAAWEQIRQQADKMVAEGQYQEAIRMLNAYSGRWVQQTASNRAALAHRLRETATRLERQRTADEQWTAWISDLAVPLVQGKFSAAQDLVAQAQSGNMFSAHQAEMDGLAALMRGLNAIDERVMGTFLKSTGTVVRVGLGRGEITVRVAGVSGKKLRGKTLDGQAEILIGFEELSASERMTRLASVEGPEGAIARGAALVAGGNLDEAGTCFGNAGPPLAAALLEKLNDLRSSTAGGQAESALARVLKLANANVVGPYNEAAWLAVIKGARPGPGQSGPIMAELDAFLEKFGRTEFAGKAAPVVLALQRLCAEAAEGPAVAAPPEGQPAEVAAVPAEGFDPDEVRRALIARNPTLMPEAISFADADGIREAAIQISADGVRDLSPLATIKGLRAVRLSAREEGKAPVDLRPLSGSPIAEIRLSGYVVRDLGFLRGMKVTRLGLRGSPIASIMPLEGMALTELDISDTEVRDLTAVRAMRLEVLRLANTRVASLSLLLGLPLRELDASGTLIRDISAVRSAPLENVNLARTQVYDFTPLKGMALRYLDLSGTKVHDIAFCASMPLRTLLLRDTAVADVAALKGKSMDRLDLSGSQIKELTGLAGCTVKDLSLAGTKLTPRDLALLKQARIERLDLSGTSIAGLGFLTGMDLKWLSIENTRVSDLSPLRGMGLVHLNCQATDVVNYSPLRGMPLRSLFISGDLRGLREVMPTLTALESVNGFNIRERFFDRMARP